MNKFLFELGTEEIPATMIKPALKQLSEGFQKLLDESSVPVPLMRCYSSPRRLALLAEDLPERRPDQHTTVIGPPERIAFDADQELTGAGTGFARKYEIDTDRLEIIETDKGRYLGFRQVQPGAPLTDVIAAGFGDVITGIGWPRNMYWRESRFRFIRPIRWLIALWNEEVVDFEFEGIRTDRRSSGHRFLGAPTVEIPDPESYVEILRQNSVVVDARERRALIVSALTQLTPEGCTRVEDPELVELTCFLNEQPSAVLGRFDSSFLRLPREILVTVMRVHQKYFAVTGDAGQLEPFFLTIINAGGDPDNLIRKGHERVLRARLEDAVFFWDSDRKRSLKERVESLAGMTFQQKLGSYLEKAERLREICRRLSPDNEPLSQAALLCKTDLTTETVFEISELQGVMGGLYAREEGYPEEIWKAIYEHYQPVALEDPVPASENGALLSIADRLDTIAGCFSIGIRPRGSSDPFGLRRQAQGLIKILLDHGFDWRIDDLLGVALQVLGSEPVEVRNEMATFLGRRLHSILLRQGLEYDVINAVMGSGLGSVSDTYRRARALQEVRAQPEFESLAVAFKRIRNILDAREVDDSKVNESLLVESAEQDLFREFSDLDPDLAERFDCGEYREALNLMSTLRGAVDRLFDEVMVLAEEADLRENRLRLLGLISARFLRVADISQMVRKG